MRKDSARSLLSKLIADAQLKPAVERYLAQYPAKERQALLESLLYQYQDTTETSATLMSADKLLTTPWPPPRWAVPELLPVGLVILAGAPKVGKSWLALQLAQAVASGGKVFGQQVDQGSVLYLALEDSPIRLQSRMKLQGWNPGLDCDFLMMKDYQELLGPLEGESLANLYKLIEIKQYKLVVIDTLSRAIRGDQNDVASMTEKLSPLHEMAHGFNSTIILIDHHNKLGSHNSEKDAVSDILGSTAKGAICDTALGLYKERNSSEAHVSLVGKEIEDRQLSLYFDKDHGKWELGAAAAGSREEQLTAQELDILSVLENNGLNPVGVTAIANEIGRNRGAVHKQLNYLYRKGKIEKINNKWRLAGLVQKKDPEALALPLFDA